MFTLEYLTNQLESEQSEESGGDTVATDSDASDITPPTSPKRLKGSGDDDMPFHDSKPSVLRSSLASSGYTAHTSPAIENRGKAPRTEGQIRWLATLDCQSEVMCTRWSHDGSVLAGGLANGLVKLFTSEGVLLYTLSDSDTLKSRLPCTSLNFMPLSITDIGDKKHVLVATYASGLCKFWHFSTCKAIHTINEVRQTLCSGFNQAGDRYATGGADPKINIYDTVTKQKLQTLEPSDSRDTMNGHRLRVFAVQYHPSDPHLILSGGWDDTVQFWDDRQAHSVRSLYGPHICGDALDIDANHNHVLTGSWRKNSVLQIWDVNSGVKIKDVPQDALHKCMLYCCQWLGREYIICGGTDQNMARIIDRGTLNTVAQVFDLEQGVYCIDNDKMPLPKIAIGAAQQLYLMKQERRA